MKIIPSALLALTLLGVSPPAEAQNFPAVTFLLIPPSTRSWGMGRAGAAVLDPFVGYFNPGGLGVYSLKNPVGFARNSQQWLPQTDLDIQYSNTLVFASVPIMDAGESGGMRLSLVLSYHRKVFDLRDFTVTDDFGNQFLFGSRDRTNNFTVAIGLEKGIEIGIGATIKSIESVQIVGAETEINEATATARDVGVFVRLPIIRALERISEGETPIRIGPLTPLATIAVSYAWANRGSDIKYSADIQSFPLPRVDRFGRAISVGLEYDGAPIFNWLAARDDEIWKVRVNDQENRREGWEINLFGIARFQKGNIHITGLGDLETNGESFHAQGLFRWLEALTKGQSGFHLPWFIKNLDVFYRAAEVEEDRSNPFGGTKFKEFGFTLDMTPFWQN